MTDTIYAPVTAPGPAGVAVIRLSGPAAKAALEFLTGKNPPARTLANVTVRDGARVLDRALAVVFDAPKSYTGEDVAELHLHGGHAVTDSVLAVLARQKNLRLAAPGEFTRRAFENGKMDLTEAEAVADLIAAETEAQQMQALDQLSGALRRLYEDWAARLTRALAHQEADIEFPEDDMPSGISATIRPEIDSLKAEIGSHLDDNYRGERLRRGLVIAVVGAPNAGKSSLVNALAQRDVAIVSEQAGTTRDVIEVHLNLGGYPVIVLDTAGLRAAEQDAVEAEGIRRARLRAQEADLKLALFDATQPPDADTLAVIDENTIVALNKTDLVADPKLDGLKISAATGAGLDKLLQTLVNTLKTKLGKRTGPVLTRTRHREALTEAKEALSRALTAELPELTAEDLRLALRQIGRITGRVDVEDLLDVIFRDFCIGK